MPASNADIQAFISGGRPSNTGPAVRSSVSVGSQNVGPQKRYAIGGGGNQADPAPQGNNNGQGSGNWFLDMLNTPIIKGALNILGTGSYTIGNMMDPQAERQLAVKNLQARGADPAVIQKAQDDANNPLNILGDIISAPVKGIMGGIGQDAQYQKTPSQALRAFQGKNPNDKGNLGDMAMDYGIDTIMDPLNVVNFGPVGAAVRGAVKGVQSANIASKTAKLGAQIGETSPSLLDAALSGAKDAMAARKAGVVAAKDNKQAVKTLNQQNIPAEPASGTLSGFSSTPDSVIMGTPGKASDIAAASKKESAIRDVANTADGPIDKIATVQDTLGRPKDNPTAANTLNIIADQADNTTPLDTIFSKTLGKNITSDQAEKIVKMSDDIKAKAQKTVKPDIMDMEPPRQSVRNPVAHSPELTGELPPLSHGQNAKIQQVLSEHSQKLNTALDSGSPGELIGAVKDVKVTPPKKMAEFDPNDLDRASQDYLVYVNAAEGAGQDLSKVQKFKDWLPGWQQSQTKLAAQVSDKMNGIATAEHASPRERIFHNDPSAAGDARLKDDQLNHTLESNGMDSLYNVAKHDQSWDIATRFYGLQKFFNRYFGKNMTWDQLTTGQHLITGMSTAFHGVLNDLGKQFSNDTLARAFNILKDGGDVSANPAAMKLRQLMTVIFDPSKNNVFARNGIGKDHFNSLLANNRSIPKTWRITGDTPEQWANSWKQWQDVKNPLKMLEAMHSALMKATADVSMAAKFGEHFGLKEVPKGEVGRWMKIDKNSLGSNKFAQMVDTSLYYPKEVLDELPALGKAIIESRIFKNKTINDLMSEIYDPMVSALKMTQTVMKPGHHLMSVQSDVLRNGMLGLVTPGPYKEAWRVLRTRHAAIKGLESLDEYARVRSLGAGVAMHGNGPAKTFANIGAKGTKLSLESIYQGLEARDVILPIHSSGLPEDLLTNDALGGVSETHGLLFRGAAKVAQGFDKGVTKLTNNRVIKLNRFTAERDNWNRVALALHYMQSRHFNSPQEAFDYASKMVRKAAPTAKDMTAAESKYARRAIFYYTWQRGILNVLAEAVLERPAVAMLPSKFMYDWAENNGLNPQSYGDPFPPNTIMPSYYREMVLGPQWQDDNGEYWGVNPSSPLMDTMNTLGLGVSVGGMFTGDSEKAIAKTGLGLVNPLLKMPVELTSGTQLSNGAPITDPGQYIADLIGPERTASQLTGLTPSIPNVVARRTEAKYKNGMTPDQQAANALPILANWLTGAQLKDYTSASAVKTAQFEQKNNKQQASQQANRTPWWNRGQ